VTGFRSPEHGRVLLDVQGAQSHGYRDRGIARYVTGLAAAVAELAPELLGGLLVNPGLAWPAAVTELAALTRLIPADEVEIRPDHLLHVGSPYELGLPVEHLVPKAAESAGAKLVVTLYDLIPEVFAPVYLEDPGMRLRYRARHQLVRQAHAVLALSESTKADAVRYLDLDPARVHVIGGGVSTQFVRPDSRQDALGAARQLVPGLRGRFVLYTGGTDSRKNLEGLLAAWSLLPKDVRAGFQLVVACALKSLERNHLELVSSRLGISAELILTGYVPDQTLVALYQSTDLFVYPSRYEGYGLPVAEALACGAPVVAANASCLPELVGAPGLFDPEDPAGMAAAITAALTDSTVRRALLERAAAPPATWAQVAERTVAVYRRVLDEQPAHRRSRRRRPAARVAVVTPLPPQPTPAAEAAYQLLEALVANAATGGVDAYVDGPRHGPAEAPAGVEVRSAHTFTMAEAAGERYETVIYCLGDSEHHTRALDLLHRRPGIVVALDSSFLRLFRAAADLGDLLPENRYRLRAVVAASYPSQLPDRLFVDGALTDDQAAYWGILLSRPITALAQRYFTTSPVATRLARLDAPLEHEHKVTQLPTGGPARWAAAVLGGVEAPL
jgi:glycosyltransferase involved in cell wall biosynthesis